MYDLLAHFTGGKRRAALCCILVAVDGYLTLSSAIEDDASGDDDL